MTVRLLKVKHRNQEVARRRRQWSSTSCSSWSSTIRVRLLAMINLSIVVKPRVTDRTREECFRPPTNLDDSDERRQPEGPTAAGSGRALVGHGRASRVTPRARSREAGGPGSSRGRSLPPEEERTRSPRSSVCSPSGVRTTILGDCGRRRGLLRLVPPFMRSLSRRSAAGTSSSRPS
jgi:hypothetical protein